MTASHTPAREPRAEEIEAGRKPVRPDLWDVLQIVRRRPGFTSAFYCGLLRGEGFRGLHTGTVLRRLKHLEALGKVERAPTSYATQSAWVPVYPAQSAAGHPVVTEEPSR